MKLKVTEQLGADLAEYVKGGEKPPGVKVHECAKVEFFDTFVVLLSETGSDVGKVEIADIVSIEATE